MKMSAIVPTTSKNIAEAKLSRKLSLKICKGADMACVTIDRIERGSVQVAENFMLLGWFFLTAARVAFQFHPRCHRFCS